MNEELAAEVIITRVKDWFILLMEYFLSSKF